MADYTDSKNALGSYSEPLNMVDAEWLRHEPLITPDQVISRFLWGLNLRSPETKEEMPKEVIGEKIADCITEAEENCSINIFPTQIDERQAFDRNEYMSMGYFRLRQRPVSSIESLKIMASNDAILWQVSKDWIDSGFLDRGLIYIVPINVAVAPSSGSTGSAGGAAFLAILGQQSWVPAFWRIKYTTGFPDGKLPRNVNNLIGLGAAIKVLGMLAAANAKQGSKSLGIDGLSQSSSNPGPQVYKERKDELQAEYERRVKKIKNRYGTSMFAGNV